uniref:Integrase catalytic domain-containing protein n=1 Tax=Strongyloides venezuelensis TaxID=75913 RepID=A0A0K0FJU0_STRVS
MHLRYRRSHASNMFYKKTIIVFFHRKLPQVSKQQWHDISIAYHKGFFALDVCKPIDHSNKKLYFFLSVPVGIHFTTLEPLYNTRKENIITAMKKAFIRHKPTKIRIDNATYFKGSKVMSFLTKEGIEHDYNTPSNHSGNCYAERFIGKALLTPRKFDAELYEKLIQFPESLSIYIRNPLKFKEKPRFIRPFLATKFNNQRRVIYFKKSPNGKMLARNINNVR